MKMIRYIKVGAQRNKRARSHFSLEMMDGSMFDEVERRGGLMQIEISFLCSDCHVREL